MLSSNICDIQSQISRPPVAAATPETGFTMQLVLISGLSGSGKSVALNVMEDCGHYVVDNLPSALLPQLVIPRALPAGVQLARYVLTQVHAATWRRALQALSGFDRRAALGHIHVPTLLVAGAQDTVAPPAVLQGMAAAVSGARCVSLADAGHLPHLERPDEFDELLLEFLRHARAWLH